MDAERSATLGVFDRAIRARWTRRWRLRGALLPLLLSMLLTACGAGGSTAIHPPTPTATSRVVVTASPPPVHTNIRGAGVNVEPSYRPWRYLGGPAPQSWWCVTPNCVPDAPPQSRIDTDLGLASELGVNMIRLEFPWRFLEPQRGAYDWARADLIVREAARFNVQLQPIIVWSPAWVGAPSSAPNPQDFKTFATALTSRYHSSIHYWELWNEPDLAKYWNAGERSYVQNVLIPGYQGIKAADPGALVIMGGPSWASQDWYNGIYTYGGGDSFDIIAWHSYGNVSAALLSARNTYLILNYHHQTQKPLWLGEFGVQDSTTIDDAQTSLLAGVLRSDGPIAQADWYTLRDEDAMTCCPPQIAISASWGLVKSDATQRKAGFYALKHLISTGLPTIDTANG